MSRVSRGIGPFLLVFVLLLKVGAWASEALWFEAESYGRQFERLMAWQSGALLGGSAVFALWLGLNAHLAWRWAARSVFPLAFFEKNEASRFLPLEDRLRFDPLRRRITIWVIVLVSWLMGLICAAHYATFLRAYYGEGLGQFDLASGYDLSFFLFQLPLWHFVSRFALAAIVSALLLVLSISLYEETLGVGGPSARLVGASARHLAWLWAALILWRGAESLLGVPQSFVGSGNVAARVFDAVDIRLGWTSSFAFAISAPIFALFSGLAIARRPRPRTFLIGLLWFTAAGNVPFLLPLVAGHAPGNGAWRQALERHFLSTRRAWDLEPVQRRSLTAAASARFQAVDAGRLAPGLALPALWPARAAREAMNQQLNARRSALRVESVKLQREGQTLRYLGVATSPTGSLAGELGDTWAQRHTRAAGGEIWEIEATRATREGEPVFAPLRIAPLLAANGGADRDSNGDFDAENATWNRRDAPATPNPDRAAWVLAQPRAKGDSNSSFGVAMANPLTRLVLAARFFEPRLLWHRPAPGEVALWHRGAAERCAQIAPFLDWPAADVRPLLVREAGSPRLKWLVAGLVWTDDFPDSATPAAIGTAPGGANYGRQAAVGVVDGLSGRVSLFALDEDEPYLALYRRAFPGLFAPLTSLSNPIRAALRPSPTLLQAQALVWTRYHESEPTAWTTHRSDLRPLLAPSSEGAFRSLSSQASGNWLILPLAGAVGQAGAPGAASPLVAILGADERGFAARRGHLAWTQWRPTAPLLLPDAAAQPAQSIVGGRLIDPWPTLISVVPRLDTTGRALGVWVTRGVQLTRGESAKNEAPSDELAAATNALRGDEARGGALENRASTAPRLESGLWLAGNAQEVEISPAPIAPAPPQGGENSAFLKTLTAARAAWRDVQQARRRGDWNSVASAEKRLDGALKTP